MVQNNFENNLQKVFLSGVLIGIASIVFGWISIPTTSPWSILAGLLVFILYGLGIYFLFGRLNLNVIRFVRIFGFLAGLIFSAGIILEYFLLGNRHLAGILSFSGHTATSTSIPGRR